MLRNVTPQRTPTSLLKENSIVSNPRSSEEVLNKLAEEVVAITKEFPLNY